jgi:hypothetical protein
MEPIQCSCLPHFEDFRGDRAFEDFEGDRASARDRDDFLYGTASARTSDPGASIGRIRGRWILRSSIVSR